MHLRILLTTSLAALALPAAAHAGSVEISAGHVVHTAAAGEFNALTVAQSGTTAIVRDANHRLRPLGPGCVTQTVNEVRCQGASRITTKPGDGFDTITVQTGLPVVTQGGSGSANYAHHAKP